MIEWLLETDEQRAKRESRPHWTEEHPPAREQIRCLCGRFAKYGGDQHYYNGWFDCYRYFINCAKCGEVTVECV